MKKLSVCFLVLSCALFGCGSSEESEVYSSKNRVVPLPAQARLAGNIPAGTEPTRSNFGGTELTGLSFFAPVSLEPAFNVDEVYWGRADSYEILSPSPAGCEITGTELYFPYLTQPGTAPLAELHIWGWDSSGACETYFQKVAHQGITWRLKNLPGMYGESIKQADIVFAP